MSNLDAAGNGEEVLCKAPWTGSVSVDEKSWFKYCFRLLLDQEIGGETHCSLDLVFESEERFRNLAENTNAVIGIVQGSKFVYVNPYLANQDLEKFAHFASPDLKEPLRTVTGYPTLLQRRFGAELQDEANEFIDITIGAASRMQSMIQSMLDYAVSGWIHGREKAQLSTSHCPKQEEH